MRQLQTLQATDHAPLAVVEPSPVDVSLSPKQRRKRFGRFLLRALNGAAVGSVLGCMIWAALGLFLAELALRLGTVWLFGIGVERGIAWYAGVTAGFAIMGLPRGACQGSLIAIRDAKRRTPLVILIGAVLAVIEAVRLAAGGWGLGLLIAIPTSDLLCSLLMALALTRVRSRWRWWSRWESGT